MQYYVYILYSEKNGSHYIGQTENIELRLHRHNRGDSRSTRLNRPWKLGYVEQYSTRSEAMKREKYLKSPAGYLELKNIKDNLITHRNVAQPG